MHRRESVTVVLFQSLLGSLKTPFIGFQGKGKVGFQSLLGSLKTLLQIWPECPNIPVSIPFRQSQNLPQLEPWRLSLQVSIPFRQSQNPASRCPSSPPENVSIPFRQSQNQKLASSILRLLTGFNPFQVVSKRTSRGTNTRNSDFVSIPFRQSQNLFRSSISKSTSKFQSLLGSLKTFTPREGSPVSTVFQSLLGSLKTSPGERPGTGDMEGFNPFQVVSKPKSHLRRWQYGNLVSIPFRQSQNGELCSLTMEDLNCFNPFQVVSKQDGKRRRELYNWEFQSLLGSLKTSRFKW